MQTSIRPRENGPSFAARKGHLQQLSISDDSHHVTEAIGDLYDDDGPGSPESKRSSSALIRHKPILNNGSTTVGPSMNRNAAPVRQLSIPRKQIPGRKASDAETGNLLNGMRTYSIGRGGSPEQKDVSTAQTPRERSNSETATSPFPLNDIDYESSPAAVAQELSNLQALRRMSMDVGAAGDPDLPQLSAAAMPTAPSPTASQDDSARLFWVPARLHPELAPKEFKSFLESKAEQIRRRSGELSSVGSPSSSRSSSLSTNDGSTSLRRKKSMLSRQIQDSSGYEDGADRLERKKSLRQSPIQDPNLEELESLVSGGLARLSSEGQSDSEGGDVILPSAPGSGLKRSTRTQYRRGGSMKGRPDRSTFAERAAKRAATTGAEVVPSIHSVPAVPPLPSFSADEFSSIAGTSEDPSGAGGLVRSATNFSRLQSQPSEAVSSSLPKSFDSILMNEASGRLSTSSLPERPLRKPAPMLKGAIDTRPASQPIPQIVEVPPPDETPLSASPRQPTAQNVSTAPQPPLRHPERVSSKEERPLTAPSQRPSLPRQQSPVTSSKRPPSRGNNTSTQAPTPQSLDQISAHPSPLPGNDTNTQSLSFIPTLTMDKRADNKRKEEKKSGWGWLLGKDSKDDKDKEAAEKPKAKIIRPPQSHDNTRLDVLQTSIDGSSKGRESLVLDRESFKLEEERKKESVRKSTDSGKREKEGLFSSIFGAKKSKPEKEHKRHHSRGLSPEPPHREMKPDVDYNWTRFSILEERAIYRMAHIKLANPRRALYSQVLLSNFMYSYLAKVQQMHPQMNLPTSAKQQKQQQQQQQQVQQQQQQRDQPEEFVQYQRYQQQQTQQPDHHQQPMHQGRQQNTSQQGYEEDSNMHESGESQRSAQRGNIQPTNPNRNNHNQYYHQQQSSDPYRTQYHADDDDEDMW